MFQNSFVVVYKNVSFNTNAEYVRLNASIATNRQSFTAHITVLKPFNNFYMDVRMFSTLVHTAEPKMRELFSRSANYCEYVRQKPMPDIILNILHEEFARRSNGFMLKCPVNVVTLKKTKICLYNINTFTPLIGTICNR